MKKSLNFYSYDSVQNPWIGGGGAYRDSEVLSRMRAHFDGVKLFVGYYPGAKRRIEKGVEIIPLGIGKNEILSRITFTIAANWKLLWQPQIPTGLSLSPYAPLFMVLLHRKKSYGVLHHIIGNNWTKKLGPFGFIAKWIESNYYRLLEHFIISNDVVAEQIAELNPSAKILRTGNGFADNLLQVEDTSQASSPTLLFIGRLDPFMKGLDILIESFALVHKKNPQVKLILAGRGDQESQEKLTSMAKNVNLENKVIIKTNITEADKRKLLSECTIFVSPSRFEGWGIAAVEANAAGKPVVVSEASGFKNSISQGVSGIRVAIGDTEALAAALLELLANDEQRKLMGRQAREWARQFTWDIIAEKEWNWLAEKWELAP